MLLERLLRHDDAKRPFIPSSVFCSFWREVIRQRIKVTYLLAALNIERDEMEEFKQVFIHPCELWTRSERIKHSYMVQDLLTMSDREKRTTGEPFSVHRFKSLLDTYERNVE